MSDGFKPLNLAQLYQGADAAVGQAMQMNLMAMQAQRMKQEYDEEDALRSLAKTHFADGAGGDLRSFSKAAMAVAPLKAPGYAKMAAEAEKTDLEKQNLQGQVDERRMKLAADRLKFMNESSTVPFLKYKELLDGGMAEPEARKQVQPHYVGAIRNLVASGLFKEEELAKFDLRPEFDPTVAEAGMRQVLGAKDSLTQYWNEKNFRQKDAHHADSLKVQIRGQDITLRGQNLTDARAREDLAIKGLEVKENEDGTYSVIDKKTKEVTPVLGADGQPMRSSKGQGNDTERMSAGFATRMEASEKILAGIGKEDQKPGIVSSAAGAVPFFGKALANIANGSERQKAEQAQKDWVRAKLRKESGAVIADEEMAEEIRTYFPQIGDSEAVIKQKAEARARANSGMVQNAGRAYKGTKAEAPKTEVQTFATEAEAAAAAAAGKIKPGDKIKVGNVNGTWQ